MLLHFTRPYTSLEERIILWLSGKAAAKTLLRWVWREAEAMKVTGRVLSQSKSESFVPYTKTIKEGGILSTHTLLSRHPEHRNQSRNAPKCYTLCPELYFLEQKTERDKLINDPIQGKLQLKHISFPILFFAFTIVFSKSSSNDTHF